MSRNKVRSAVVQAVNRPELRTSYSVGILENIDRIKDQTGCRIFVYPSEVSSFHAVQNALEKGGVYPKGENIRFMRHVTITWQDCRRHVCVSVTGGFFLPLVWKYYSMDLIAYRKKMYCALLTLFLIDVVNGIIAIPYAIFSSTREYFIQANVILH